MPGQAHALVQDADNANTVSVGTVDNDVSTDQVSQMRGRQVVATMAKLRVVADRLERIVDFVAVGQKLVLPPGLAGVAQDVDEVLARSRGKLEYRRLTEGHLDPWAGGCAWH